MKKQSEKSVSEMEIQMWAKPNDNPNRTPHL